MSKSSSTKKPSKKGSVFGILLCLIGLGLTAYTIYTSLPYWKKSLTYDTTSAQVTGHKYDNKGNVAIIVEYQVGEVTYTIEDDIYTKNPVRKSTNINVKYNPENPSEVIIDKDQENLKFPLLGLMLFVGGLLINIITKKIRKAKSTSQTQIQTKPIETNASNNITQAPTETFNMDVAPAVSANKQAVSPNQDPTPQNTKEEIEVFNI